ncbi:MAG: CvpA family protein [Prevotellaceae bacterium]|jgi:membrane protein required for colicin V production|nr:CvpA family protein [Prevotellaceae bacterium]
MSVFDIIVIILLAISAVSGFHKGLIMQIFGILAIFLGVFCAFKFSGFAASLIGKFIDVNTVTLSVIAFIITVLAVWIGVILLGRLLDTMFKMVAMGLFNRLFGSVFALIKTIFIIGIIVYALNYLNLSDESFIKKDFAKSKIYGPMERLTEAAFPYINFDKFDKKRLIFM